MARAVVNVASSGNIGDIKSSMLTLAQFQALNGTNWVLANGASAVGTKYATTTGASIVPDLRGVVLRGKNNGRADGNQNPDGDVALGTFQADENKAHQHAINVYNGTGVGSGHVSSFAVASPNGTAPATDMQLVGANESRMKNVTVNHFIKVN